MKKPDKPPRLNVQLTPYLDRAIRATARRLGTTRSAAARVLLRDQLRYLRWIQSKGRENGGLAALASRMLEEHPDATKAGLFYHLSRRAGRWVDNAKINEAVEKAWAATGKR